MERAKQNRYDNISVKHINVRAAVCAKCNAKIYPTKLLKPHLNRHQRKENWFHRELADLQFAFAHMRA